MSADLTPSQSNDNSLQVDEIARLKLHIDGRKNFREAAHTNTNDDKKKTVEGSNFRICTGCGLYT